MPQVLVKLLELCRAESAATRDFADLVATDAGMSARILGIANSAAFGSGRKSANLQQALVILGVDSLKTLVIGESIAQVFSRLSDRCPADISAFWRHSLSTAVIARELALSADHPQSEEAYLAGLLHDVGRLALAGASPHDYLPFFIAPDSDESCEQERTALGITHAEAGAWMIERWNLDSFLADSALYHHQAVAEIADSPLLIRITHAAHRLAAHGPASAEAIESARLCNIMPESLAAIADRAAGLVTRTAEQLGIALTEEASENGSDAPNGHERLAEAVRETILVTEATRSLQDRPDDSAAVEALLRAAHLVFGLDGGASLVVDPGENTLVGVPVGKEQQRLAQLAIPLDGDSLVARTLQHDIPCLLDARSATNIADNQLLRILGREMGIALPLRGRREPLGVLLCTGSPAVLADLGRRMPLVSAFARQGALALESARERRAELLTRTNDAVGDYREAARRMVHEASNPLAIIRNYVGVLGHKLAQQQPVTAEISLLDEELARVSRILDEFASRPAVEAGGLSDINRIAREVVRIFEDSGFAPAGVSLSVRCDTESMNVAGDAGTIRQIIVNLVKNAVEAVPSGGSITIATRGPVNFAGEMLVELSVRDSGPGIPQDMLGKIFGPLTSSKEGPHRGLGLRIVKEMVEKLEGKVICCSDGGGTSFTIFLPLGTSAETQGNEASFGDRRRSEIDHEY